MTATDELRRLLDERGVEWRQSSNVIGCVWTYWESTLFGAEVCAMDNDDGMLVMFDEYYLTPEQAVEATLGRGECRVWAYDKWDWDRCEPYWEYNLSCGHTVMTMEPVPPRFCPDCGAKVVTS